MLIVSFMSWWYTTGWVSCLRGIGTWLYRTLDFFSIDILLRTWLMPFRQIGIEPVGRGLDGVLRAMLDQLVSRSIGAVVRLITMIVGAGMLVIVLALGLIVALGWLIMPVVPIAGALLFAIGWLPSGLF